jgi:hypothetical protein
MLNPLHRAGPHHALDMISARPSRQSAAPNYNSFLSDSLAAMGGGPAVRNAPVGPVPSSSGPVFGTFSRTRQEYVLRASSAPPSVSANNAPGAAVNPTASVTANAPAAVTASSGGASNSSVAPAGDAAVVQALNDALAAAGINTDGLNLTAHTDLVTYPGGAYINRYISVEAHGHEEGLMTDLVSMNPNVAVLDIRNMLAHG